VVEVVRLVEPVRFAPEGAFLLEDCELLAVDLCLVAVEDVSEDCASYRFPSTGGATSRAQRTTARNRIDAGGQAGARFERGNKTELMFSM